MAKFNVGKWLPVGFKVLSQIMVAVPVIESLIGIFKSGDGGQKKAAAKQMVATSIGLAENLTDKDLLDDDKVQEALDNAIDAFVAVQNAIAAAKAAKSK